MVMRSKKRRGPKPKYLDVTCPNPRCKHHDKKCLGNVAWPKLWEHLDLARLCSGVSSPVGISGWESQPLQEGSDNVSRAPL